MAKLASSATALARAVLAAGGQSALARAVGVTPQAVQQWVRQGQVSHHKVLDVHLLTSVPCHELRPDLFLRAQSARDVACQDNAK